MFDLEIANGLVVNPRRRIHRSVYVLDGQIAAVAAGGHEARERFDADGRMVMPGMVDTHVHFMDPADLSREDFPTGSAAAAAAGVTAVIEHTHGSPVRTVADLIEKRRYLQSRSLVDFGLGAHAWPGYIDQVEGLWGAGAAFMKAFTCTTHGVPGFGPARLLELFERTARVGIPCLVHCEDDSITEAAERSLRAAGLAGGDVIPMWRSRDAELVAVAAASLLASRTGASVTVAHVSHLEALLAIEFARSLGGTIAAETCPQ